MELKLPILTPHRSVEKISWRSDCNVLCCIGKWFREGLDSKDKLSGWLSKAVIGSMHVKTVTVILIDRRTSAQERHHLQCTAPLDHLSTPISESRVRKAGSGKPRRAKTSANNPSRLPFCLAPERFVETQIRPEIP